MRLAELERLAARHVPGKGVLEIQGPERGLVNETYRVLRDGAAYAVRVAAANPHHLGVDRGWEARVLTRAAAADLAPSLLYCDPGRAILISSWVDGRAWSASDVRQAGNLSRIADLLHRIHALECPQPVRVVTPGGWIDFYAAGAPVRAAGTLRQAADRQLALLEALPRVAPVLCHSDLHTQNLIDRGGSLLLLDWEYAHAADPFWDLAGWSANNDFGEELTLELLRVYLGRTPAAHEFARLHLLVWLYDFVCLLWSECYLNLPVEPRGGAAEGADPRADVSARAVRLEARLNAGVVESDKFRHTGDGKLRRRET